jgi:hypothetical protein
VGRGSQATADTAGEFSSEQPKFLARPKLTPSRVSQLGTRFGQLSVRLS